MRHDLRTLRTFVYCVGLAALALIGTTSAAADPASSPAASPSKAVSLAMKAADDGGFQFATGLLEGRLRSGGKSLGLAPVSPTGTTDNLVGAYGWFSPYRIFTTGTRYGDAAWNRKSTATLLPNGGVEVRWPAEQSFPFELAATYRWSAPGTLDLGLAVKAEKDLPRFEVFLASYFRGFPESLVYVQVKDDAGATSRPGFMAARKEFGAWQLYPRDPEALKIAGDGRWTRPPNPVDWKTMPRLAAPLAMRRDSQRDWSALLMAPPGDCFAVCTPHEEEGHRSLYLSLFGRDVKAGQSDRTRARLVVGRKMSEQQAIEVYHDYVK